MHADDLQIRKVSRSDCRLLWMWVNEPEAIANFFSSRAIPWEEHVQWFETKIHDPNCHIFIGVRADGEIGQVRFEVSHEEAEVSISVDRRWRGQGNGERLLELGIEALLRETRVRRIHSHVKPSNRSSLRLFEQCGFVHIDKVPFKGEEALHLAFERGSKDHGG